MKVCKISEKVATAGNYLLSVLLSHTRVSATDGVMYVTGTYHL